MPVTISPLLMRNSLCVREPGHGDWQWRSLLGNRSFHLSFQRAENSIEKRDRPRNVAFERQPELHHPPAIFIQLATDAVGPFLSDLDLLFGIAQLLFRGAEGHLLFNTGRLAPTDGSHPARIERRACS